MWFKKVGCRGRVEVDVAVSVDVAVEVTVEVDAAAVATSCASPILLRFLSGDPVWFLSGAPPKVDDGIGACNCN